MHSFLKEFKTYHFLVSIAVFIIVVSLYSLGSSWNVQNWTETSTFSILVNKLITQSLRISCLSQMMISTNNTILNGSAMKTLSEEYIITYEQYYNQIPKLLDYRSSNLGNFTQLYNKLLLNGNVCEEMNLSEADKLYTNCSQSFGGLLGRDLQTFFQAFSRQTNAYITQWNGSDKSTAKIIEILNSKDVFLELIKLVH